MRWILAILIALLGLSMPSLAAAQEEPIEVRAVTQATA